jgi:hypothetical protein
MLPSNGNSNSEHQDTESKLQSRSKLHRRIEEAKNFLRSSAQKLNPLAQPIRKGLSNVTVNKPHVSQVQPLNHALASTDLIR